MTPTQSKNMVAEYIRNATAVVITVSSAISIIVAIVWFFSDIKADITATNTHIDKVSTEAKEQLTAAVVSINRRIDSNEYRNKSEIQAIWLFVNGKFQPEGRNTHLGLYTQKIEIVNGKRIVTWVPAN
jgi:hypothetical protein